MGKRSSKSQSRGFSAFFILAATFLALGIPTSNQAFIGPGLFFLVLALSNGTGRKEDSEPEDTGNA